MTLMTTIAISLSTWLFVSIVVGLFVGRAMSFCARGDAAPAAQAELPFGKRAA